MTVRTADNLVTTEWLEANLHDPQLRIVDTSIFMIRKEDGTWRSESGREKYNQAHIPGAQFIDLLTELQDPNAATRMMLPPPEAFAESLSEKGIGSEHQIVVYAAGVPWWATRFWWMLKANGHDHVAVLDGGFKKWCDEKRDTTTDVPSLAPDNFRPDRRPALIADKEKVQATLADNHGRVVNALSPQLHRGESDLGYGRPGRIAGSQNLSSLTLIDHDTGAYLPKDQLHAIVSQQFSDPTAEIVCYCGGGIAATMDAFVFAQLGFSHVSVYDASLEEWAADARLPMETG